MTLATLLVALFLAAPPAHADDAVPPRDPAAVAASLGLTLSPVHDEATVNEMRPVQYNDHLVSVAMLGTRSVIGIVRSLPVMDGNEALVLAHFDRIGQVMGLMRTHLAACPPQ